MQYLTTLHRCRTAVSGLTKNLVLSDIRTAFATGLSILEADSPATEDVPLVDRQSQTLFLQALGSNNLSMQLWTFIVLKKFRYILI